MTTSSQSAHHPQTPRHVSFRDDESVAVTPHHLATETAVAVMAAGGNAVDGAVAANAVLGVVLPDTCGVGGDLFALVHRPGMAAPVALNASGRAGSGASAEHIRRRGHVDMPMRSPETVTVPGCVDGWEALLAAHGTMPLSDLLAPAITLAREGFEVSIELAESLAATTDLIGELASARTLLPGGAPPKAGDVVTRHDLAGTLEALAVGGRAAFYGGAVGAGIIAATGGAVTGDDLDAVQADWVDPLRAGIHGLDGWTTPPNSQGYLTLAALVVVGSIGAEADPADPAAQHALIEAYRAVASERDDLVTDPATAPMPAVRLLDPARLSAYTDTIADGTVATRRPPRRGRDGTAYLCTRDRNGMGVSLIQSNFSGIGAGLDAGGTGVFLHNRGSGFNLIPGHPNELAPRRRPLHTLSPTLWTDRGRLHLLLGTRGGHYQPQILVQVASHRLGAGLPLVEAVDAPRWVVDPWEATEDPPPVTVESRMPDVVIDGLRSRGHSVDVAGAQQTEWGPVAAIELGEDGGVACGDRRVSTSQAAKR